MCCLLGQGCKEYALHPRVPSPSFTVFGGLPARPPPSSRMLPLLSGSGAEVGPHGPRGRQDSISDPQLSNSPRTSSTLLPLALRTHSLSPNLEVLIGRCSPLWDNRDGEHGLGEPLFSLMGSCAGRAGGVEGLLHNK